MKPRSLTRTRWQRAQSLVELAISLTVMLLLLSGAVTFGMALFSYVSLRDAAQEGALYGSFNPCEPPEVGTCVRNSPVNHAAIEERIRNASRSPIDLSDPAVIPDSYITTVLTTGEACEGSAGGVAGGPPNAIQVTVEYDYPIFMPFVGGILGSQTIHLTATVTDTILEPRCPPVP